MNDRSFALSTNATRRDVLLAGSLAVAALALPKPAHSQTTPPQPQLGNKIMSFIKTSDGTESSTKTGARATPSPSSFITAGRSAQTTGTPR